MGHLDARTGGGAFTLLLLADGRLPVGGHAHSAGVEAAVLDGRVRDESTLDAFVRGRLATVGLADAALAAAATHRLAGLAVEGLEGLEGLEGCDELDAEAGARIAPPPLREASHRLGHQLVRVAARCWPCPLLAALAQARPSGPHLPVALGVVAAATGLRPLDAAQVSLHHAAATPAYAAVRLLGLDPFAVAALLAVVAPLQAGLARTAAEAALGPLADLPAGTGPVCELAAVEHHARNARLFVT